MNRVNFDFTGKSQDDITKEFTRRLRLMRSQPAITLATLLISNRNDTFTSRELELIMKVSRESLLSIIGNLKDIHGFKIINVAKKGTLAEYQLVAFEVPRGRGHTGRKNKTKKVVIPFCAKPLFYHPLIEKVFC